MLRQLWIGVHNIVRGTGFVQHGEEKANGVTRCNLPLSWTETSRGLFPPTVFHNSKIIRSHLTLFCSQKRQTEKLMEINSVT